ncbi:MAG: N-acetyltransferase family protein [Deinococcales bacterium]
MKIVECTFDRHAKQILDIFNEAIIHSTALFDYKPRSEASMVGWFEAKQRANFPVIGIEDDENEAKPLIGFASYGTFRAWPAYQYSVEHSLYVHKDYRGRGIGKMLMSELIHAAKVQNYHLMVGGIEATNISSIKLHESLGFTHAGTIKQAGFKFSRWLDLSFYQLLLPTPETPNEN